MKKIPICILLFITGAVNAQTVYPTIAFKHGDQYTKQIFITSNSVLRRGSGTLSMSANSAVYRLYTVNDASADAYSFKIVTQKVTDTINGMGQHLNYSTDNQADKGSSIEKSLHDIVGKTTSVMVNKAGVIRSVTNDYTPNKNDSLLTFSGLISDKLVAGNTIELLTRLPAGSMLKKGSKWADSVITTDGKDLINYTVDEVTASTTKISFTSTGSKHYNFTQDKLPVKCYFVNNETGYMDVDNKSAIITQRFAKTASSGYQSINGVSLSIEKTGTITELINKQ